MKKVINVSHVITRIVTGFLNLIITFNQPKSSYKEKLKLTRVAPTEELVVVVVHRVRKTEPPHAIACGRVHQAPVSTDPGQTQSLYQTRTRQ